MFEYLCSCLNIEVGLGTQYPVVVQADLSTPQQRVIVLPSKSEKCAEDIQKFRDWTKGSASAGVMMGSFTRGVSSFLDVSRVWNPRRGEGWTLSWAQPLILQLPYSAAVTALLWRDKTISRYALVCTPYHEEMRKPRSKHLSSLR